MSERDDKILCIRDAMANAQRLNLIDINVKWMKIYFLYLCYLTKNV